MKVNKEVDTLINKIIAILYNAEGVSWEDYIEMKDFLNHIRLNWSK